MMLSPKQAAERAAVSRQLLYLWCAERRFAYLRVGGRGRRGRILIDSADLDAFLATLKIPPCPPEDDQEFRHARRPSV
jgi:excisionase family DNA binding protein